MPRLHSLVALVSLLVLGACGGSVGSPGSAAPAVVSTPDSAAAGAPQDPSASGDAVDVRIEYSLPRTSGQHLARRAQYISTANATLAVDVTPVGGSTTSTSGPCTTVTCTVSFSAAPGPTTLAFTLKDAGANVLSRFSTLVIVAPSTLNTFVFTANPVVKSVALQLASASVNAGAPSDTIVNLVARDAANQVIVGTGPYLDSTGAPLSFLL